MRAEDIRAFAARPHAEAEHLKRRHWASLAREGSVRVPLGHLLLEHAKATCSAFPSAEAARQDFEHQVRLKLLVDRARAAFSSR